MAITTVYSVAERANILVNQVNELVGTGDGANKDFDLKKDHLISGQYTLYHAPPSGNDENTFTTLTETTHYTIDKISGRITLTTAGLTEVASNKIYADYYYLSALDEQMIGNFLVKAEARMRLITGKIWESETFTEFYDGTSRSFYPTTDRPFQRDRPTWDSFKLDRWPVTAVSELFFLDRTNSSWDSVASDDGGSFTDNTSEANSVTGTAFNVFAAVPAVNDAIYFGLARQYLGLITNLQTLGTDAGSLAVTWEYYNGSTWASLSNVTAAATGTDEFSASGKVTWDFPSAWAKTTINSSSSLYFVRARLSAGSYTAVPTMWEAYPDTDSVLFEKLSVRSLQWTKEGRVTFIDHLIRDGVKNIRVTYTAGVSTSDEDYQVGVDLSNALGALMSAIAITGGSFDNETSFTLGPWATTVGEVYVNVEQFVKQLKDEIIELKAAIGGRHDIV